MSASFQVTGKVHAIFDTQQVKETFKKREFVLDVEDGNYSQYVKFQLVQDKCALLDNATIGDVITVHFNLRGNEYTNAEGKVLYFTNLDAWRLETADNPSSTGMSAPSPAATSNVADDDDLPF